MTTTWLSELYATHGFGLEVVIGIVVTIAAFVVSSGLSLHVLHRRRQGQAVAWLALIWMSPLVGWFSYLLFGVNRVQRKALRIADRVPAAVGPPLDDLHVPDDQEHFERLARANTAITGRPVLGGNSFEPLRNGDEAYPAMLEAIRGAERSITLLTYILDCDAAGSAFITALIEARERGVEVRVLIDGIGARRAWRGLRRLQRSSVPVATFLWSWVPWKMALLNLRNHRKLLVVDGAHAFTGGLNIREAYVHEGSKGPYACDLHFEVRGPVVRELQRQFALDWAFETDETLEGPLWFPELEPAGSSLARVLPHGPDEDIGTIVRVLFQAVMAAEQEVLVICPYFLPDEALTAALEAAAQRGVDVKIVLPETNEPALMNPVTVEDLGPSLKHGVRLGFKPGPFEHTKLTVVDRTWVLLGSSNWDPRSLRLNFELNVEVYDPDLAARTLARLDDVLDDVRWLKPEDVDARSWPIAVSARVVRLLKPYL